MTSDVLLSPADHLATAVRAVEAMQPIVPRELAVAPFALLRFATVPLDALAAMRPTACLSALARAEEACALQTRQIAPLEDALFQLVSRIAADDRAFRRTVLQLKRAVHNGTDAALDDSAWHRVAAELDREAAHGLRAWRAATLARDVAMAEAERELARETRDTLRPGLRSVLQLDGFRHALALAAPGLLAHAARASGQRDTSNPDKFERALLGYLVRASAKTSPFSSFMSTTAIDIAAGLPARLAVDGSTMSCRTRLGRGVLARIAAAAVGAERSRWPLHVNETLARVGPQRFRLLQERPLVVLGRPWRQQSRTHFQLHEMLSRVLLSAPAAANADVWRARFEAGGIEPARAQSLVGQLLDRGVLRYTAAWDAFDAEPERSLRSALWSEDAGTAELLHCIDGMIAACDAMAGRNDASLADRSAESERIRELELQAFTALDTARGAPLQNVVVEDAWSSGFGTSAVPAHTLEAVADIAGFLSNQVEVSVPYWRLRKQFVDRFGEGGRCSEVLDFLIEASNRLVAAVEFGGTEQNPDRPPARAGSRLPVTVQAQPLADGASAAPILVVNKVFENAGWLAARFGVGDTPEHARLREGLGQWLEQVAAGREPVDLPVNGECNDLQTHPRLTRRVLQMPGEPFLGTGSLQLGELQLHDDAERQELVLSDRTGREIHPCYLGGTLPSPTWGMPYALVVLGQPYQLMRPPFRPPVRAAKDVEFTPRITVGRAIVRRAMWWVTTEYLRRAWFCANGARRLAAVRAQLRANAIPEFFFARRPVPASGALVPSDALDVHRKPLGVDTANPFCLASLERFCQGVEWISITEALPWTDNIWLRVDGVPHVSELQLEFMIERSSVAA